MQIGALGPLTIDGRTVEGNRLPALLLPLLYARGRIVPVSDLVDTVWDGAPPANPVGALQALVSRARRLGLTVTSAAGGYRLDPQHLDVDVLVAQDLLVQARAAVSGGELARAADLAGKALSLWTDDDDVPTVGPSGRLFADLLTIRVEGELAGHNADGCGVALDDGVLDRLRQAVDLRPFDEPLTALLIRSLAVRGREAEALAAYQRLRDALAETYGTDPSAVAAQTHLALLRGELSQDQQEQGQQEQPQPEPGRSPSLRPVPAATETTLGPPPPALGVGWSRPTTSMLGRDADVIAVEQQLAQHPLVTLVAVGGAGKTRLAAEVARRTSDRGEAVYAVELAGVRDPLEVLPTLLGALGASESTTGADDPLDRRVLAPHERMLRAVAALDGLLVLDNCEHLLDAVADVTAQVLAAAGAGLRVLATSRAPLGVVGELVHPVDTLPDDDALAVLEARGRQVRPALAWDRDTALELCHRLDNLPLALELAAARLRSMPLEEVLAGVSHRFALLDDALRGLPDRHRGLWAMVDWSWALLDPVGRTLVCDLAVVPGPFTAAAATAVAGLADDTVRRGLAVLVEQSLLSLAEPGDRRPARYRMLETVREYGEARLAADDARDVVMDRLTGWAAREARWLRDRYIGPEQLTALATTTEDHDTFVAALRWSMDRSRDRDAFAIAATLLMVWTIRGLHLEVVVWARQLLQADSPTTRRATWERLQNANGTDHINIPDPDDAAAVAGLATVNSAIGNDLRTASLARRLVGWAIRAGQGRLSTRTTALAGLSSVTRSDDHDVHLAAAGELVDSPDAYLRGLGLFFRAALRENHGDVVESAADARASYAYFESVGDHWGMGMAASAVGQWEASRGSTASRDGASGAGDDSRDNASDDWLSRAVHHLELVGAVQDARTILVVRDLRRAVNGSVDAVAVLKGAIRSPSASAQEKAHAGIGLGILAGAQGRWDEAVEQADAAVRTARSDTSSVPQSRIVTEVAAAVLRIRAGLEAEPLLEVAAHSAFPQADMPVLGTVALGYSELAASRGNPALAEELWAIGMRLGANLSAMYGGFPTTPPSAKDGSARGARLEQAREVSVVDTIARLATLVKTR